MEEQLSQFIRDKSFPCLMAKAVINTGLIKVLRINSLSLSLPEVKDGLYQFVDEYRARPKKLRSFILVLDDEKYNSFETFEEEFWGFLTSLNKEDKKNFPHDPRVSDDPQSADFSYSIKSEAFFILAMHPKSPRLARRFMKPAIVFNLHQQFEDMRTKGIFSKVRNLIRKRDTDLQGTPNPMLSDFGEKSEIFQYLGKVYQSVSELNIQKGFVYGSH